MMMAGDVHAMCIKWSTGRQSMKSNANPGGVYLDQSWSSRGSSSLDAAGFRRRSTRQVFVGALDACDFAGRGALVTSSHTRVCITPAVIADSRYSAVCWKRQASPRVHSPFWNA